MAELPKPEFQIEYPKLTPPKKKSFSVLILLAFLVGFCGGLLIEEKTNYFQQIRGFFQQLNLPQKEKISEKTQESQPLEEKEEIKYTPQSSQEELVIKIVKEASPAVVSVIITKDLPIIEQEWISPFEDFEEFFGGPFFEFKIPQYKQKGTQKQEIGGGTAFFVSEDGMLLTNAHVVVDKEAEYTVLTNDGKKYPAKVLARDSTKDLAILKIEGGPFPTLKLGDSNTLEIGQTVIAIGNALGEFRNTISVGVISGLGRKVTASGGGVLETLEDVIQTDAAINRGNSGGPLLNLKGEVIGVNFAMASGAENIGFAIPINQARKNIEQVKKTGKIVYPFLGVRYVLITEEIQKEQNLKVDYGALIVKGEKGESAIFPNSPAEKAGLKEGDIILEFNGEKITFENNLAKIISQYNPGDQVVLKVLRKNQELTFNVVLGERTTE